jgi:hypothetical protein
VHGDAAEPLRHAGDVGAVRGRPALLLQAADHLVVGVAEDRDEVVVDADGLAELAVQGVDPRLEPVSRCCQ